PSAISFRTPNKGGSHSNVPHLLLTQDQAHPSLSRIVSGFFHVEDALRASTASCGNLEALHQHSMANNTTFSDKLSTVSQQATLRKSVSAIGFHGDTTEKNWKDGLVMSSSSINDHHLDMTATALTPYEQVLSQGRAVSSASLTSHPTPLKEHSSDGQQRLQNHGVVAGAKLPHHGGFFSKPIVRSNEESFRYLMALDR
ncbi:hypothetical protein V3C99_015626, partial [Haemonchus contortus]